MVASVRWITIDGQQRVLISIPGGTMFHVDEYTAWNLGEQLMRLMSSNPPPMPDNEQGNE